MAQNNTSPKEWDDIFSSIPTGSVTLPTYGIGEKVLVKDKYDKGCGCEDYNLGFTESMMRLYGGKIQKIASFRRYSNHAAHKMSDDGYIYKLEDCAYNWVSSMFEERPSAISELTAQQLIDEFEALRKDIKEPQMDSFSKRIMNNNHKTIKLNFKL